MGSDATDFAWIEAAKKAIYKSRSKLDSIPDGEIKPQRPPSPKVIHHILTTSGRVEKGVEIRLKQLKQQQQYH